MSDSHATNFEDSLIRLQQLVQQLESGEQGLESSLQLFEEGTRLLRDCYQRLELAERRIEILTGFDSAGNPVTTPFDASKTFEDPSGSAGDTPKKTARKRSTKKADETSESLDPAPGELPF